MHIPELKLQEYPEFVEDKLNITNYASIEQLTDNYREANTLNKKEDHEVKLVAEQDNDGYDCEWINIYFTYYRKPNKEDTELVDSYNYRMIENYNQFINENPKVAKALDMKIQEHEN